MSNKPKDFVPAFENLRSNQQRPFSIHKIPNLIRLSEQAGIFCEKDVDIIAEAIKGGIEFDKVLFKRAESLIQEIRSHGHALSNKGRNQKPF